MAKRLQVNRKKWPVKSNIAVKSFITKQRGHVYSDKEIPFNKPGDAINCLWKGQTFKVHSWDDVLDFVHTFSEFVTDY